MESKMINLVALVLMMAVTSLSFAEQHTVTVQNFSFTPADLTIAHGDTVIWNAIGGFHNVHHLGTPSLFGTDPASAPWTYQFIFNDSGDSTFHYQCDIHTMMQGTVTVEPVSGIDVDTSPVLQSFPLEQNYPNPFNSSTTIQYSLQSATDVKLTLFDMLGREVQQLYEGPAASGTHELTLDASGLAGGMYFYRLQTPLASSARSLVYLK
jgi:plastocyanin